MTKSIQTTVVTGKEAMAKKIDQKVMVSFKKNQIEVVTIYQGMMYKGSKKDNNLQGGNEYPLFVWSINPVSSYYALTLSNSGMTDKHSQVQEVQNVYRTENTVNGLNTVYVEKEVFMNLWEIHAALGGNPAKRAFMIQEDKFNQYRNGDMIALTDIKVYKPFVGSASQTRKGDSPFIPEEMVRLDAMEHINFKLEAFYGKGSEAGRLSIDVNKTSKRTKMAASSSKSFPLLDGYNYASKEIKAYKHHSDETGTVVGEATSTIFTLEKEGAADFKIELAPDFEVITQESLVLTCFGLPQLVQLKEGDSFKKNGQVSIGRKDAQMRRLATDGASYLDADYAKSIGLSESGVQFRFTPVGKGLLIIVPELKGRLGVDMLMFEGAVKGDIETYFKDGAFDFAILNVTRRTEATKSYKLSRQIITAIQNKEILKGLAKDTMDVLQKVHGLDYDTLREFIGIHDLDEEGNEVGASDEEVLDMENLTASLYASNPDVYVKSASFKRKLFRLIEATTKSLVNGSSLYLKDGSIKHMIVDPITIVRMMENGWLSAVRGASVVGIRRHQGIVSGMKEGHLVVEHEKAFLGRFPFLHGLEGQLINADGSAPFNDLETYKYYTKWIAKGYFQGLMIYSAWDMVAEGQSGADFDGDTTVYTTNRVITDNFEQKGLYLDYSLVQQKDGSWKMVEGCPFPGDDIISLDKVVSAEQLSFLEENNVTYFNGKFDFPAHLADNREFKIILADAMCELAMINLVGNDIGRYTNINASIMTLADMLNSRVLKIKDKALEVLAAGDEQGAQLLTMVAQNVKAEAEGYESLAFYMAAAIRWEIDKAKHGGAYKKQMRFLEVFEAEDPLTREDVRALETEYNISLERFLFGNVE